MTEVNHAPITELERDACLLEDVVNDAGIAWKGVKDIPLTPRAIDRVQAALHRLHAASDELTRIRLEIHNLLREARK